MGYIGSKPANKVITASDLADDIITSAKIADGVIVAGDLAANSVDSSELIDGSIDTSHIDALQVTTAKIAADAIDSTKLADNAVDSEHYTDGSIDTAHIDALQVTDAKIAAMAATKLTGSIADARVPASAVTQHVTAFDDTDLRSDIMTLALKEAITENRVAYNLPNAMIEQFQDDNKLGTETTGDRNASEYWGTTSTDAYGVDSYTKLCVDDVGHANGDTTFTDISPTGHTLTRTLIDWETRAGPYTTNNTSTSIRFDNGGYAATAPDEWLETPASADWQLPNNSSWTIDWWMYYMGPSYYDRIFAHSGDGEYVVTFQTPASASVHNFSMRNGGAWADHSLITSTGITQDAWIHWAIEHDYANSTLKLWKNGAVDDDEATSDIDWALGSSSNTLLIGQHTGTHYTPNCYMAGIRWSKGIARTQQSGDPLYAGGGTTSFTVPPKPYTVASLNATGTLISTAQTANASQTKVSGVVLYKNESGTATLGTDLKIYFTCNGGTNWTESTPTAAGTFSSGILMAKCPEVTCTIGTDIRYKAVWANQSSGSKETRLHGIGMNY